MICPAEAVETAWRVTKTASAPRSMGIVGLGYVGLSTVLAIAESGVAVLGCDISESRLTAIKDRRVDLLDTGLARLDRFLDTEMLTLTTETSGLSAVDTVVICVPTPVDIHLVPDLTALWSACASVVDAARPGQTIVLTSTTFGRVRSCRCRWADVHHRGVVHRHGPDFVLGAVPAGTRGLGIRDV